jgi:hypothetical protein
MLIRGLKNAMLGAFEEAAIEHALKRSATAAAAYERLLDDRIDGFAQECHDLCHRLQN